MSTYSILSREEERILKGKSPKEQARIKQAWALQDELALNAFTARPLPDTATLYKLAQRDDLHPTLFPTLSRMLEHKDCKGGTRCLGR